MALVMATSLNFIFLEYLTSDHYKLVLVKKLRYKIIDFLFMIFLGLWLNESKSKHKWMQIFDEIKSQGVEDIFFILMDGVSGLEAGAKSIFKEVVVQRCMVHLIRNSIRYVPSKDYKAYTSSLKKVYSAPSLKACQNSFESFCKQWSAYLGAIETWKRKWAHVELL
jgi:transposase-like protein